MEFKEFFSLMKNRISNGADVPYFFRDLVAMITTVPESEWGHDKRSIYETDKRKYFALVCQAWTVTEICPEHCLQAFS